MEFAFSERRARLFDDLPADVETVLVPPGATLYYLTGVHQSARERPALLVLQRDAPPAFLLPALEHGPASGVLGDDVAYFTYPDTATPLAGAREAFAELRSQRTFSGRVATEYRSLRFLEYALFAADFPATEVVDLHSLTNAVRLRKDEQELALLREAAAITDGILEATIGNLRPGLPEPAVLETVQRRVIDSDADGFGVNLVTSGPRTGHAHASTGTRQLTHGDPVLLDLGVVYQGYYSDVTRTVVLGEPSPQFEEICEVETRAAEAAREAVGPGVPRQDVDRAARRVIQEAGYGDAFRHRVGHGIGLEGHERPYVAGDDETPFAAGEVFTVEPTIHRPGVAGVRTEDMVAVTEEGVEVLTDAPRGLRVV